MYCYVVVVVVVVCVGSLMPANAINEMRGIVLMSGHQLGRRYMYVCRVRVCVSYVGVVVCVPCVVVCVSCVWVYAAVKVRIRP